METIFNDETGLNINGIIDFVLIIVGLIAVNVLVFIFLKRKTVRVASVALSASLIVSHILKFEFFYNLLLFIFIALLLISFVVNLAEVRNLFANKYVDKGKIRNKDVLIKKNGNEVEKIFNHEALYEVINDTTLYLSKHKIGAIMTFERKDSLEGFMKNGSRINAPVSFELLITIFYPGTRLHDGAVIIRGNKIVAASVYFSPTTKPLIGKYGSRHRASIGISEVCDAVTVVVSEETGRISIAYNGEMQSYSSDQFIKAFENYMNEDIVDSKGHENDK